MDYTYTKLYFGIIFGGDQNKSHAAMMSQCFSSKSKFQPCMFGIFFWNALRYVFFR